MQYKIIYSVQVKIIKNEMDSPRQNYKQINIKFVIVTYFK